MRFSREKKALTVKALPAFAKALGLKSSERELLHCLFAMIDAGIVREAGGVYSPVDRHLVLSPERHAKMIQEHFQTVLKRASGLAKENFRDPHRMYFASSSGVRKDRLPELKARLIETLLRFVDESEDGEDEEVVSIAAALI